MGFFDKALKGLDALSHLEKAKNDPQEMGKLILDTLGQWFGQNQFSCN